MKRQMAENLLEGLSAFVQDRLALAFPPSRWDDLERRASSAAQELGFTSVDDSCQGILSSSLGNEQIDVLAGHLVVRETYFWREPQVFEALERQILPQLFKLKQEGCRRLRIWSAGCSTGEEAYSIAIALRRFLLSPDDWDIRVLATDVDRGALSPSSAVTGSGSRVSE